MDEILKEGVSFDAKKEIISSLGVYELRGLARVLGVKSPTTKKREELISLIFQIIENENDLSVSNVVKRGRPYKAIASVQGILDDIATNDEPLINQNKIDSFEELTVFNQELPKIACQSSNIFPSSGVLRKGTTFGYFIDNTCQRLVYISSEQIAKYRLESGDYVDCAVFEINNGVKCFVKKVNKINGINAEEYTSESFSDYDQIFPKAEELDGKIIAIGGRNVLLKKSPLYMNSFVKTVLDKTNKDKVVVLGTNLCFEDKAYISSSRENFAFTSEYTDKLTDGYDRILDAISFTERLGEINESVLLLVCDFASVLNVLDSYFIADETSQIFGHKEKTIVIAKKLISLAKAKSNNQNITTLILCDKQDTEDNFIKSELLKISNILE